MTRFLIPLVSLGLYLSFAAHNSRYVTLSEMLWWGLASLGLGALVLLLTYIVSRNALTQTVMGCVVLVGFYSFGYLYKVLGLPPNMSTMCAVSLLATMIMVVITVHKVRLGNTWRLPIILATATLIVYPLTSVVLPPSTTVVATDLEKCILDRDVYILVLDRYARGDILEEYFNYDNTPFIEKLESRGFQVAKESRANYCWTEHALASMLNMQYLDVLLPDVPRESESEVPLNDLVTYNAVKAALGDSWTTVASWWQPTKDPRFGLSEYSLILLNSTLLQPIVYYWNLSSQRSLAELSEHQLETVYGAYVGPILVHTKEWSKLLLHHQFDTLQRFAKTPSNRFFLAHILSPHPPYTCNINGEDPNPLLSPRGQYVEQLQYTNKLVLKWLDTVPKDAVVVLMSDEGPKGYEDKRFFEGFSEEEQLEAHISILMAVRGFDIYDSITPINMMRLLTNKCMDTNLPPLPDKSYNVPDWKHPYQWEEYE